MNTSVVPKNMHGSAVLAVSLDVVSPTQSNERHCGDRFSSGYFSVAMLRGSTCIGQCGKSRIFAQKMRSLSALAHGSRITLRITMFCVVSGHLNLGAMILNKTRQCSQSLEVEGV